MSYLYACSPHKHIPNHHIPSHTQPTVTMMSGTAAKCAAHSPSFRHNIRALNTHTHNYSTPTSSHRLTRSRRTERDVFVCVGVCFVSICSNKYTLIVLPPPHRSTRGENKDQFVFDQKSLLCCYFFGVRTCGFCGMSECVSLRRACSVPNGVCCECVRRLESVCVGFLARLTLGVL